MGKLQPPAASTALMSHRNSPIRANLDFVLSLPLRWDCGQWKDEAGHRLAFKGNYATEINVSGAKNLRPSDGCVE